MKKYILSLLLLVVALPLSQTAQAQTKKGPKMVFERTSHDFGDVPRKGGDLIKEFRFVNEGDSPLVIKKITKSCSCMILQSVTYAKFNKVRI